MELLKQIKNLIFGSLWFRFVMILFAAGISLIIGPSFFLAIIKIAFKELFDIDVELGDIEQPDLLAQVFGMILCTLSIGMFLYFNGEGKRQRKTDKLEVGRNIQRDIIGAEAKGRPFTDEQLNWFKVNPRKEEEFFSIIKNAEISRSEQIRRLKHDWSN